MEAITEQQAAEMAAIVARWPRKVFASLVECGGDESVQVEIKSGERYCYVATKKDDPEGVRGLSGYSAADAIEDLHTMIAGYSEMVAERAAESGRSTEPYDAPSGGRL